MSTTWYRVEFWDGKGAWRIFLSTATRKNAISTAKELAKTDRRVRVVKEVTSLVYGYNDTL